MLATKWCRPAAIFALVLLGGAITAHAAPISSAIEAQLGPGPQNLAFQDDAIAVTSFDGGDGTLDVGDRITAHLIFRDVTRTVDEKSVTLGGSDVQSNVNELTGYAELELKSKTGDAQNGFVFEFGAWSSGGTITQLANDPNAVVALFEDPAQNGVISGMPLPDPTTVDGQLWGVLGVGGGGQTKATIRTEAAPNGLHNDGSSAAVIDSSLLLGTGSIRTNLVDQGGAALTDDVHGVYRFEKNQFGTDFAGSFDFFGGDGTNGGDFTATMEFRSNVQIIPLPPAALAALPGLAMMAFVVRRRRRNA